MKLSVFFGRLRRAILRVRYMVFGQSVDLADYDVDPTGTRDSTAGIQQAINDAFARQTGGGAN